MRRHAGAGGVERQLADRDAHAARAEIAEPEDALAVGHDDEAHILRRPVAEDLADPAARRDRQVHAAGFSENMREFLARLAHRRRVDQRHVGRRIRHQHRVEQCLVARLQIRQHEVFLQIAVEIGDLGVTARHLQVDIRDGRRQQPFQPMGAALRLGERGPLVQARVVQQRVARGVFRCHFRHSVMDCSDAFVVRRPGAA